MTNNWQYLNYYSTVIHNDNNSAGWWEGEVTLEKLATKLCLIHSEISECMEGLRKGIPDDKLPHRSMEEVELADALIRIFDYAGARDLDVAGAVREKLEYNKQRLDHQRDHRAADGGKKF